jgi:hypothetical protein
MDIDHKIALGLFFLPIFFLGTIASAASPEINLKVPGDFKVTEVAKVKNATSFTFDYEGGYIFAQNQGKFFQVLKISNSGESKLLVDHTSQTITNLAYHQGIVYVISRGQIFKIKKGKVSDLINGLPTYGDNGNSNLVFYRGFMYFGVGTATNSGIVGPDNTWLSSYPSVHDIPCGSIKLSGVNITADNFLTANTKTRDQAVTGSFMPYNMPASTGQTVFGMDKCNGAILKASPDGETVEVYAWGLHNPKSLSFDDGRNLYVLDGGMQDVGVRPIKAGQDSLYQVTENTWYGWPDFSAGSAVDQPALLAQFPNQPPKPTTVFDLNQIKYFLAAPEKFLAGSGLALVADDRIKQVSLGSSVFQDFLSLTNTKLGDRIAQIKFGPDDKLYVLVALTDHTSKLFAVESTRPPIITGSLTKKNRLSANWFIGSSLAFLMGAGIYVNNRWRKKFNMG